MNIDHVLEQGEVVIASRKDGPTTFAVTNHGRKLAVNGDDVRVLVGPPIGSTAPEPTPVPANLFGKRKASAPEDAASDAPDAPSDEAEVEDVSDDAPAPIAAPEPPKRRPARRRR